ncbi:hypothetical protein Deipe_1697 [Deinococcus peraridilitoris DSM 19664]|uniref:Uncharacterized protein n=1 Tax=Deinococcus peraridilitoris (strain DSM 19664 / LMG 22246 / CIP 109416 / KR-200) TaxID=937777 RepID=L0A016_DEIPD|nr:hypothetical protein Deipe_1697 [Deinococcus peraridilitoris DSM 19664]
MPNTPASDHALRASCERHLNLNRPLSPRQWFARMSASQYAQLPYDQYDEGEAVQLLEQRVAKLHGRPMAGGVSSSVLGTAPRTTEPSGRQASPTRLRSPHVLGEHQNSSGRDLSGG